MANKLIGPGTTYHIAQKAGFSKEDALRTVSKDGTLTADGRAHAEVLASAVQISDAGAAELLAREFGGHVLFSHASNTFWICGDGNYWHADKTGCVMEWAKSYLRDAWVEQSQIHRAAGAEDTANACLKRAAQAGNRKPLNDALALLRSVPDVAIESRLIFDVSPYLFAATNGAVDLRTGDLIPVEPSMRISRRGGCPYTPDAVCPNFLEFLRWCFQQVGTAAEIEEAIEYVRIVLGVILSGDRSAEKFLVLYGAGANGKSTFIKLVQRLMGQYACTAPSSMLNATRQGRNGSQASPDVMSLIGARLATANETADGSAFDVQLIKALVSNEPMAARDLYSSLVTFTPSAFLVIVGNWLPRFNGADDGFVRRLDLIPFTNQVPPQQRDPGLLDKLWSEAEGILAWAVSGAVDWFKGGRRWPTSRIVERASAAYKTEQDIVGRWVEQMCARSDDSRKWLATGTAREWFTTWARAEGHNAEYSQTRLTQRLERLGFPKVDTTAKGQRVYRYRGLALAYDV